MSEKEQYCHACGMPLSIPNAKGVSDTYCTYCSDAEGNLKPWEEAVTGLAAYLDSWQNVGPEESRKRAKRYLTAMPAWAHKADD
ncbi:zinc ribbon domain-containing protein [Citrobacter farmeri]|uniref:Zn-finger protein n=1 Tax=Citrobacter amalonaticus Y19 TaxID=1261127 RepID=A0A0F6TVE9_CITAM|nr:zinc ribbon domain-containing protein [Citrobacter amalonaticus]AKE59439.1 Zn-finger protein [Citrobacter amalonaticus Y19]EKV5654948.1 hypothetical protein [Citrobacter farmeri]